MFNEYLFLQILLILVIFFLFWITDIYNLLILGIFYLFLFSIMALYNDVDILISFLIIIDLGVFLVLFAFLLHLNKFLTFKNIYDYSFKNLFIVSIIIIFITFFYIFINFTNIYNFNKIIEYTWFFFISYIDYYYLFVLHIFQLNTRAWIYMHFVLFSYF